MTKPEFIEYYGMNVYQVRLRAALSYLGTYGSKDALDLADEFVRDLLAEQSQEVEDFG